MLIHIWHFEIIHKKRKLHQVCLALFLADHLHIQFIVDIIADIIHETCAIDKIVEIHIHDTCTVVFHHIQIRL